MRLNSPTKVYIDTSKLKNGGRGVFANVAIKKGELIERCPTINLSENDTSVILEGTLITYLYYFGKRRAMIALGFGSIYNHTDSPNAQHKEKYKEQVIEFIAVKDIKKGKEITVNYNQRNPTGKHPLWFIEK